MADALFNSQRCRVIVVVLFLLYLLVFFTILRMVMRNGRTIVPDDTHFDLSFLQSLPDKTEYKTPADDEQLTKSNSNINNNNGGTEILGESLNQSRLHLVSFASTDLPSVSPTPAIVISTTKSPPPPPPPSLSQRQTQQQQLNAILEALIGAGDFVGWANLLSSADLSSLPLAATFFIPGNDAMSNDQTLGGVQNLDPLLIAYHIIPQRLTFSDLQQFKPNTRIPTLLPSKFIVVTNNSLSNFTIDGSRITYPDLYANPAFTVHGVDKILEYSAYGAEPLLSPPVKSPIMVPDSADVAAPSPPLKPKSVLPSFFPARGRDFSNGSGSNIPMAIEKLMMISVFLGVSSIFLLQ